MASIEEKVEEHYKKILDELGIRHYGKTESINRTITDALRSADSKSGGSGNNYPDIQLLLENKTARRIPVMIEAKGLKNRLEKISKSGQIELKRASALGFDGVEHSLVGYPGAAVFSPVGIEHLGIARVL